MNTPPIPFLRPTTALNVSSRPVSGAHTGNVRSASPSSTRNASIGSRSSRNQALQASAFRDVSPSRSIRSNLFVGSNVRVLHKGHPQFGVVKFKGNVNFAEGVWVGIALKEPVGNHDGYLKQTRYFQCAPKHGLFVRAESCDVLMNHKINEFMSAPAQFMLRSSASDDTLQRLPEEAVRTQKHKKDDFSASSSRYRSETLSTTINLSAAAATAFKGDLASRPSSPHSASKSRSTTNSPGLPPPSSSRISHDLRRARQIGHSTTQSTNEPTSFENPVTTDSPDFYVSSESSFFEGLTQTLLHSEAFKERIISKVKEEIANDIKKRMDEISGETAGLQSSLLREVKGMANVVGESFRQIERKIAKIGEVIDASAIEDGREKEAREQRIALNSILELALMTKGQLLAEVYHHEQAIKQLHLTTSCI